MGAFGIIILSETTRLWLGTHEGVSQLVFGLVLIVGILFMPRGIYGSLRDRWRRRRRQQERRSLERAGPVAAPEQ